MHKPLFDTHKPNPLWAGTFLICPVTIKNLYTPSAARLARLPILLRKFSGKKSGSPLQDERSWLVNAKPSGLAKSVQRKGGKVRFSTEAVCGFGRGLV
jgi:hypothetical protein